MDDFLERINAHEISLSDLYEIQSKVNAEIKFQEVLSDKAACKKAVRGLKISDVWLNAAMDWWFKNYASEYTWEDISVVNECLSVTQPRDKFPVLITSIKDEFRCCCEEKGYYCAPADLGLKYFDGTVYLWPFDPDNFYFCDHCADLDYFDHGGIIDDLNQFEIDECYVKQFQDALRGDKKRRRKIK